MGTNTEKAIPGKFISGKPFALGSGIQCAAVDVPGTQRIVFASGRRKSIRTIIGTDVHPPAAGGTGQWGSIGKKTGATAILGEITNEQNFIRYLVHGLGWNTVDCCIASRRPPRQREAQGPGKTRGWRRRRSA